MRIHRAIKILLILFVLFGLGGIALFFAASNWSSYNYETREFIEELASDPGKFDEIDLDPLLTTPNFALPLPDREDVEIVHDRTNGFGLQYYSKPMGPFGIYWVDQHEWSYVE